MIACAITSSIGVVVGERDRAGPLRNLHQPIGVVKGVANLRAPRHLHGRAAIRIVIGIADGALWRSLARQPVEAIQTSVIANLQSTRS